MLRWETGLVVAAFAILLLGIDVSSQFLTNGNFFYLCISVGEVAIMTLPLTFIVITGEIDLSVASTLGLASALVGFLWSHGWPMPLIIPVVLAVGVVTGAFNGLLVTRVGLPSLAVTIGTLTLYRGIAIILLGPDTISDFPFGYTKIGVEPVPHVPFLSYSVLIFLILAAGFGVVLHFTAFGRSLYAIGTNQEAALFAGIRVKRIKLLLFVVSGVVCSGAGILYTLRLSTAVQGNGLGLELSAVAIVLLGGVSIFGGKGSILGVVLAVFVFAGLQNALFLSNFNELALGIVTGGLLLVSVLVPNAGSFVQRGRELFRRRARRGSAAAAARGA
ncbi:MAG TPA: ABC transporter permease [Gaiellaceae bacterium]|jgi:rhamnose transport system permease protein|nr:ABC transporter permease [Gaiellaceae bacterium]